MAVPFEHPVNVRWRDTDALGHVNHAVFLTYLEEGRDAFFTQILRSDPVYVVVRLEVDLHTEVRYEDHQVAVRIEVERLGATSLTTRETILLTPPTPKSTEAGQAAPARQLEQAQDTRRVAAQARVVTVRWDADRRKPTPFTEAERIRLTAIMAPPAPASTPPHAG
jgi:YbgC/YbaW family acyl-CoA thioester hydrolase